MCSRIENASHTVSKLLPNESEYAISPQEKLLITLRYLATGCTFKALTHIFMRGDTTIGLVVKECTKAIWNVLQPLYMPVPTEAIWESTAQRYYELWDLPNCIGSIDGKHCRINKFSKTGSHYYNYKSFFSVVLMACANADGIFLTIDVGEAGRMSDGGVFRSSTLGRLLDKEKLLIPEVTPLPNDELDFPFYFVGDEAFPLKKNLMRPYPQRLLDNEKRIFNYRLSRGRKSIECAFGMLTSKFEIFQRPILCQEESAISIIKSACVLHNFIKLREGTFSIPQVAKHNRLYRNILAHNSSTNKKSPSELRDYLKSYFLRPENALQWQDNYIV
ncbi:uncharacterized protein LOC129778273 [Toxorhynchites rutilus septentrionalis]|uniref:uncharacterized protein LOC129769486 n=1 Tax=Toxorhynchites rutilus septentrionalis TaxID=329112 RepID=UPI00247A5154|nr:uncharacterized protein LOC129769486 [Toxorhynchites rutilus septentrionalis]XP_055627868.1 uncharacterized protein LOC129769545 [Toxorhynchites rutilus septentrionalis]XP_055627873.1 uncharacterized protein LOC129769554 [Toxorhynchites rutilus septentrionalis]XP_055628078.1 uncharacterized protein LOC129769690 [Toxorhynchites rutilus septentrionalis]XP_055641045.1 uncharacterized protein LOC129778273 [Toxorhynchites rutilus septentrionalis]